MKEDMAEDQKKDESSDQITVAMTQLFVRMVALETVLIEEKLITPKQLAEATLKAMVKLQEFQDKQETSDE